MQRFTMGWATHVAEVVTWPVGRQLPMLPTFPDGRLCSKSDALRQLPVAAWLLAAFAHLLSIWG